MKKFLSVALLSAMLLTSLFALTGCTKKYGLADVKKYAEKTIGLKDYTIKERYTSVKDADGHTDYYWHIKYNCVEFDIIDNHYYGTLSMTNRLEDNFDRTVVDYYYGLYNKANTITYDKDYVYYKNSLMSESADSQGNINETKLKQDYDNIVEFLKTIDFNTYPVKNISVEVIKKDTNGNKHVKWLSIYQNNHIKSFDEFKKEIKMEDKEL